MRVVLDTNLVVRAARRRASLARSILLETLSERHSLILSNSLYFEIFKVMYYDDVRRRHGLNDRAP
jgi:predicted nucleic acid-binding protein